MGNAKRAIEPSPAEPPGVVTDATHNGFTILDTLGSEDDALAELVGEPV